MWDAIRNLLGSLLAFFYDVVPNFGLSIILLTILVNFIVFPLTLKQTRSTRAMQELQPEVEKIRKKHKDEPEVMNQEVMKLYQERGVSPLGCFLPLLVQMPIWFALFQVLREPDRFISADSALGAALLEGPLTFLTMDLAVEPSRIVSDFGPFSLEALPYLMLVGIVVLTGFMQQRLSTPPNNNQQNLNPQAQAAQRVTKFLPIFFGVISYIWPAGLNLYFATSNTFRTGQQLLIFRIDGRPGDGDKSTSAEPEAGDDDPPKPASKPQGSVKKRNRRRRG